jgi:hypothetical protein
LTAHSGGRERRMEKLKFYRYEAVQYSTTDYDGELISPIYPNPRLELREFTAFSETPKGFWIGYDWADKPHKWVSKTSVKRFAYPTKEEALANFIKRTEKRIDILDWQLKHCRYALESAIYMQPKVKEQVLEEVW